MDAIEKHISIKHQVAERINEVGLVEIYRAYQSNPAPLVSFSDYFAKDLPPLTDGKFSWSCESTFQSRPKSNFLWDVAA